ncbi:hypothetical protein L195_g042978, partial [Trifolium pratense]
MVVKMMKWRPWPPPISRKYQVKLLIKTLRGCCIDLSPENTFAVEIRWKGPKLALSSLRRNAVVRNFTGESHVRRVDQDENDVVLWDEEFISFVNLSANKDNSFHPWEIAFTVFNGLNQRPKTKIPVVGTASLNLAEFASVIDQKDFDLSIPLTLPGGSSVEPSLSLT